MVWVLCFMFGDLTFNNMKKEKGILLIFDSARGFGRSFPFLPSVTVPGPHLSIGVVTMQMPNKTANINLTFSATLTFAVC